MVEVVEEEEGITDEGEEVVGIPRGPGAHDEKIRRETERTRKVKKARKKRKARLKEETVVVVAEAVSEADVAEEDVSAAVEVDTFDPDEVEAAEEVDDPSVRVRVMEERTPVRAKAREMKNEVNEDRPEAVVEEVVGGAPVVVVAVDVATHDVSTEVVAVEVVALGPLKVAGVVNNPVKATRMTELMKAQHENKNNKNNTEATTN